jgi:hypothetical protein
MVDGTFSERDSHVKQDSPWADKSAEQDAGERVSRAGWGDNVAPLARNMQPIDPTMDGRNPNQNGGNGQKPWRAGFGSVAPDAQRFPQNNGSSPWGTDASPPTPQPAPQGQWRAGYPDSSYRGPGQDTQQPTYNNNPGNGSPWRAGYPDSTYRGPGTDAQPPVNNNSGNSPWRTGYPDSSYPGPRAQPYSPPENPNPNPAPANQGGGLDWRRDVANPAIAGQGQTGQFPGMPRGDAPSVPSNPGLNDMPGDARASVEKSLEAKSSVFGHLMTGAGTGAAIGAGEWYLDKKLLTSMGEPQTGLMQWWQNHSPMLKEQGAFADKVSLLEQAHNARLAEATIKTEALTKAAEPLKSVLDRLDAKVAGMAVDDAAREIVLKQQAFLGNAVFVSNPAKVAGVIGTAEEVEAGKKLFVTGSKEAKVLSEFAKAAEENGKAGRAATLAEAGMENARKELQQSIETGAGTLGGRTLRGAATGLGVAGLTLAAGYGMDYLGSRMFGYKAPELDSTRLFFDGIAVPAVLLSNIPARYKFAIAGSAFIGARVADYASGTGQFSAAAEYSKLLRPNLVDGVGITAAAMAPVDGKTKAALVGGAWLLGRAYNGVSHMFGWDGSTGAELRDTAQNAFTHDQMARTDSSFDNAVKAGKKLGEENEVALELQMRDWLAKQSITSPVTHMRGTAVLGAALGEFRLESGTRLDINSHADKKDRILKGYNYDFGGEATTWLRMSAGSLVSAQQYAETHKGQTVDGQVMDDNYIQQLKNEQKRVEDDLNKVYGEHDIKGIFNELKDQARVNGTDMDQALVRMKNTLDVTTSKDPKFVAKSSRDVAIGFLAKASYMATKNNGGDANVMYQAAIQYLRQAEQLDPNNPDNKKMEELQLDVVKGIPGAQPSIQQAINNQYKSNWNNPFQLQTPQLYPKQ